MATMPLLEIDRVGKFFGGVQALSEVSFSVEAGGIVGIMGANGAGKTTLFALIAGNDRPSTGAIRLRGESLVGLRPDQICRRGVARTFQIVRPFGGLSVLENVAIAGLFGARSRDASAAERNAREIIARVGLAGREHDPASSLTLSGQKRLEVARAVGTGGTLLLLDEVMAGLIPAEVDAMIAMIRELKRDYGLTVLIIEHVMQALMRLADRIVVLHLGRLVTEGTPAQIAAHPEVQRNYLGAELQA